MDKDSKDPGPPKHGLKILTVSDYIDKELIRQIEEKTLTPVDLIVSCGDLNPEYLSFLRDRLDRPLFYVKGNHDIRYTRSNPMGCENIHGRVVRFQTLNILGLEGSMWYNGGANQYTDAMMKKLIFWMGFTLWKKSPLHLVVTHAPPRHIHDQENLCHRGFDTYLSLIKKRNPHYFVHGHIHQEFETPEERMTLFHQTRVINTCGYTILEV